MWTIIVFLSLVSYASAINPYAQEQCTCLHELRTYDQTNMDLKLIVSQMMIRLQELQVKIDILTATTIPPTTRPAAKTSPTTPTTPRKQCKDGWEWNEKGGKCYLFSTKEMSWSNARSYCRKDGADLVKIESLEEQKFIVNHINQNYVLRQYDYWTGLNDLSREGAFRWSDGQRLGKYSVWSGHGHDYLRIRRGSSKEKKKENCVQIDEDDNFRWENKDCSKREGFICEVAP